MAEIVELLLHGVADEDQRLHLLDLGLALGMREDLADLGVAAAAVDPRHQLGEPLGLRHPARGAAFGETAIVDELHVEPADRRRLAEHVGLQPAGGIPHRLPAHGGVEREDQPAALAGRGRRRRGLSPGPGTRRSRRAWRLAAGARPRLGRRPSLRSSAIEQRFIGGNPPPIRWPYRAAGAMAALSRAP